MLPESYRWLDEPGASHLYLNYRCVATVRAGQVVISRGRKKDPAPPLVGVCGSIEHGKRHVERWVAARLTRNWHALLRKP